MNTDALDPVTLEAIRSDYCESDLLVAEIALKYRCTADDIQHLRAYCGWPPRHPSRAKLVLREGFVPRLLRRSPPPEAVLPTTEDIKQRLIDRMYRTIDRQLERMEQWMDGTDPKQATTADAERQARSLGNVIKSCEKVRTLETELAPGQHTGQATGAHGPASDDAERKRRELAERIRKVRERLAGVADGPR